MDDDTRSSTSSLSSTESSSSGSQMEDEYAMVRWWVEQSGLQMPDMGELTACIDSPMYILLSIYIMERGRAVQRQRQGWDEHIAATIQTPGAFERLYRMDQVAFNQLVDILRPTLTRNEQMSRLRSGEAGAIIPELRIYAAIRYLSGGQYLDILRTIGTHASSFYLMLWDTIDAINTASELALPGLPRTPQDLFNVATGFAAISEQGVINGCVGVCDGYLAEIASPSQRDTGNVRSFFSGHYSRYGLNVQAIADANCRFLTFAIAGPGSMDDMTAFENTGAYDDVTD